MAMIFGVLASARAFTLRLPRGSLASRFTSFMTCSLLLGARHTLVERGVAELRKCLEAVGDVEMAMGNRILPRRATDFALPPRRGNGLLGDIAERGGDAGRDVEGAAAAVRQHEGHQAGNVIDEDVVALLLPFAEQRDALAFFRQPTETIGPVAVMRVACAVKQARPQNG